MKLQTKRLLVGVVALATTALLTPVQLPAQTLDPWQTIDAYSGHLSVATALTGDGAGNMYAAGMWQQNGNDVRHGWVRKSKDAGATWTTVTDFVYPGSRVSALSGIAADAEGNLYATAIVTPSSGPTRWVVLKSADGSATWSIVDDLQGAPRGMAVDTAGNVNVVGVAGGHGILRSSSDRGNSWLTRSEFTYRGLTAQPGALLTTAAGLFVAGYASYPQTGGTVHWLVWRSTDGGGSWILVDDFQYRSGYASSATSIAMDARGNVYVAGGGSLPVKKVSRTCWITRRSTNGGLTWSTVDVFQYLPQNDSMPAEVGGGADGAVYVVGMGGDNVKYGNHWLVRKSLDGGQTWTLSDDFQLTRGWESGAKGFYSDSLGNLYTVGFGYTGTGADWLVRKATP